MIVAHLSDLHLRDEGDAAEFARQLDRVVARRPDHLVITGDLLDFWSRPLLAAALDALAARGLLHRDRLTVIHGNHDFASSGGYPRGRADIWRLVASFWDPPPLLAARRRTFYRRINERADGTAALPPFLKATTDGLRLATLDTVPAPWRPLSIGRRRLTLHHAEGAISRQQTDWLAQLRGPGTLVVLIHHYPLPVDAFHFDMRRRLDMSRGRWAPFAQWDIEVPLEIDAASRNRFWQAVEASGAALVLCGHVHRARLERHGSAAVGLNGQSGAGWAGRTIAYYRIDDGQVTVEHEENRPST